MPHLLEDLEIDRVDLVDEGANSASFILIHKRKEGEDMDIKEVISKMKPEHGEIVTAAITKAAEDATAAAEATAAEALAAAVTKAKEEAAEEAALEKAAACDAARAEGKAEAAAEKAAGDAASFDEDEVLKSLPEGARELIVKERAKREAAETELRKAKEAEVQAEAVAKAATLKSLPVEQDKLVELLKGADDGLVDILTSVAAAFDAAALGEIGKAAGEGTDSGDADAAWAKIDKAATELVAEKPELSKQRAIAEIIKTQPDLYREYLKGGAK